MKRQGFRFGRTSYEQFSAIQKFERYVLTLYICNKYIVFANRGGSSEPWVDHNANSSRYFIVILLQYMFAKPYS